MRAGTTIGEYRGWRELVLADSHTTVHVLPDKGADLRAIVDRGTGANVLFAAPWGLQSPGAPPRGGWMDEPFLANYEGGWQELLPNTNDRCIVDGVEIPFHGEVAALPWTWEIQDDAGAAIVVLEVDCLLVPLRLRRRMVLAAGQPLVLEEEVSNNGDRPVRFTWGHHLVLGAPLIASGTRMEVPASVISTPVEPWEDTHRLLAGQRSSWPRARLRSGGEVDLREIPGPDAGSHDDVFVEELQAGWAEVRNPRLSLGVRLEWDAVVFGALVCWQPFGGAHAMPLAGSYALGLEPWVFAGNAAAAVSRGCALQLEPGKSLSTELRFAVVR